MKNLIVLLALLEISVYLSSCYTYEEKSEATYYKTCSTNVIGIAGADSDKPYVVIKYCVANGKETNTVKIDTVTPPYLLEPRNVNVLVDTISNNYGDGSYELVIKHDYYEKGAEYFEIENLSKDKSIEFFVAGSQDMKVSSATYCNGMNQIERIPYVLYKNAPIYYLLFPEKKYNKNVLSNGDYCDSIVYFEGNKCGDLTLDKPWTVNEVMALYRAEYNGSKDIQLSYSCWHTDIPRLSQYTTSYYHNKDISINLKYYGVIGANEKVKTEDGIPVLATNDLIYWDYLIRYRP